MTSEWHYFFSWMLNSKHKKIHTLQFLKELIEYIRKFNESIGSHTFWFHLEWPKNDSLIKSHLEVTKIVKSQFGVFDSMVLLKLTPLTIGHEESLENHHWSLRSHSRVKKSHMGVLDFSDSALDSKWRPPMTNWLKVALISHQ